MERTLVIACTSALFATALGACSRTQTGEPDLKSSTARAAPAAVQAPGAASLPESAPHATSACAPGEALLFACRIAKSGKAVALCTTTGSPSTTTYRFGDLASPELTYTDGSGVTANAFHRTALTFAGATGGYAYSFHNGDVTYALYSISGNDGLARSGVVVVDAAGRKKADLECDPDSLQETESVDLIRRTRDWTPDPAAANAVR